MSYFKVFTKRHNNNMILSSKVTAAIKTKYIIQSGYREVEICKLKYTEQELYISRCWHVIVTHKTY